VALAGVIMALAVLVCKPLGDLRAFAREPLLDPAGVLQVYPWVYFNGVEMARGHFPLWNHLTGLGEPHLANIQTAVFCPIYWAWQALGAGESAYGAVLLFRLWLAAMLWFLFARLRVTGLVGALVTGLTYAVGGYSLWFMQLIDYNSQLWLPLLLLLLPALALRPRLRTLAATAAVVALVILGGHPEAAFVTLFAATLYTLTALAVAGKSSGGTGILPVVPVKPAHSIMAVAAAFILGLLLTLAASLPFVNYLSRCWSMHGSGFGFIHLDPRGFFNLILPGIHHLFANMPAEIPVAVTRLGTWDAFAAPYAQTAAPGNLPGAGPVVVGLALVALCRPRRLSWPALFFVGFFALTLGLTFGLPLFRLLAFVPPFNMNSNFKFFFSEIHACLAVLAGVGADFLLGGRLRRALSNWKWSITILGLVSLALMINRLDISPFVQLEPETKAREELAQAARTLLPPERRIQGLDGFWPANIPLTAGVKDIRSSDALFYRPYIELLNRINRLSADQGLRYFYPSYYTQVSSERLLSPEAAPLGLNLVIGKGLWLPAGIVDHVLLRGHSLFGVSPPQRATYSRGHDDIPGLFLHAPAMIAFPPPAGDSRPGSGILAFAPRVGSQGDGGIFQALAGPGGNRRLLYSRMAGKDHDPELPEVRLRVEAGTIALSVLPGPRNDRDNDWTGFAGLSWHEGEYRPPPEPLWSDNAYPIRIYRVTGLPWAHLDGDTAALPVTRTAGDEVEIDVASAGKAPGGAATLVVHEVWYPGWTAEIDGRPARIAFPPDKVSWRLAVPPDARRAHLRFLPFDFRIGLFASLTAALLCLISLSPRKK
jgi:hypothetical protein